MSLSIHRCVLSCLYRIKEDSNKYTFETTLFLCPPCGNQIEAQLLALYHGHAHEHELTSTLSSDMTCVYTQYFAPASSTISVVAASPKWKGPNAAACVFIACIVTHGGCLDLAASEVYVKRSQIVVSLRRGGSWCVEDWMRALTALWSA